VDNVTTNSDSFSKKYISPAWMVFFPIMVIYIRGISNAVNLTDGLDGLAAGV
jgi:phospho-N-acetylmuramoyl-pentapeptide-transferase